LKGIVKYVLVLSLAGLLSACGTVEVKDSNASEPPKTDQVKQEPKKEEKQETPLVKMSEEELKRLNDYIPKLRGGTFLKSSKIEENSVLIEYATFKEYSGNVKEKDYNDYWKTGDAIRKVLMEESVRLLKEFPALNEVKLVTPQFEGKKLSTTLNRKQAEEFFKVNLKEINENKKLWGEKVVTQFIPENRDKFEKQFIKAETP